MSFANCVKSMSRIAAVILGSVVIVPALPAASQAQSVESFYKDRQMRFVLSASLSGGYGLYAHTITPFLEKHLPGHPNIVVQEMQGAGGIVAANWLANSAPKDGSVITMIHRSAVSTAPLFGTPNIRFDPTKFGWIGNMNSDLSVCVIWHSAPVKNFEDLKTKPSIFGGVGAGSDIDTYTNMLINLFDAKMRLVTGYKSSDGIHLAMERGEVEGRCGWGVASLLSTKADWIAEKKVIFLAQVGLERDSEYPDVPLLTELARNEEQRRIFAMFSAPVAIGRPFLTTPDVPADRATALRAAFAAVMKDPGFIAEGKKASLDINPTSGERLAQIVADLINTPPEIVARAKVVSDESGIEQPATSK